MRGTQTDKDERGDEPTQARPIQIETGDATGEALLRALLANPRGILRFADEIKGLIKGFGRYYSKVRGRRAAGHAYGVPGDAVHHQSDRL